ncbi:MAG: alginate export family protein [Candidatus Omnitrophica bacterium]|nr:alginate export family protein [Candidatus Omnitrophota bacterium]
MRIRIFGAIILLVLSVAMVINISYAETKFKYGLTERIRHEYWKNWKDMSNSQLDTRNFFRIKSSLWGQMDIEEDLTFYVKLTNEFRAHTFFEGTSPTYPDKTASKKGYRFNIDEVVFDNLYMDMKNFLDLPLDLRIGRQDFLGTYGEGFLIMDGTPQDGSRTFYFNAAKASWKINEKNILDFIYINNPRDEEFLPIINENKLPSALYPYKDKMPVNLNTTDEEGFVLYWKNKDIENLALENYYIFKKEDDEGGVGAQAKESEINTLGTFAKYNLSPFTLRGQFAYQFGEDGDDDRRGFGGYGYIDHEFKDLTWNPKASIGFAYLSGDKRGDNKNQGWDPLFSRWPWLSELYVLSMAAETRIPGYWTNLQAYSASLFLTPTQKTKLSLWYHFLRANAQVAASSIFSGEGKNRGHLPQLRLDYTINKNISTYLLAEYLIPGNFYADDDPALFTRLEVSIKF